MFTSPFVNAFDIFGFSVKMYGVVIFLAIIVGIFVSDFIAKKYYKSIDTAILFDFYPIMIISGIAFARAYYVLLNLDYYLVHKSEILALWHGGISIHGAIFGGLIAGVIYFKAKKLNILGYADVIAYGLVLAQSIGRWGNFFNSEAFGTPTDLPWKLYIPPDFRPVQFYNYEYFHPTFLYESIWCFFVFLILFFAVRKICAKFRCPEGLIFFSYLVLYSLGRFLIEAIRIDSVFNIGVVPIAQIVSVLLFVAGVAGIIFRIKNGTKKPLAN